MLKIVHMKVNGKDVELAVGGRLPVYTCLTTGGVIVDADDVAERAIRLVKGE